MGRDPDQPPTSPLPSRLHDYEFDMWMYMLSSTVSPIDCRCLQVAASLRPAPPHHNSVGLVDAIRNDSIDRTISHAGLTRGLDWPGAMHGGAMVSDYIQA